MGNFDDFVLQSGKGNSTKLLIAGVPIGGIDKLSYKEDYAEKYLKLTFVNKPIIGGGLSWKDILDKLKTLGFHVEIIYDGYICGEKW